LYWKRLSHNQQEAQKARLTTVSWVSDACTPEQVGALQRLAEEKIPRDATKTRDTCPNGCKCAPKKGATPDGTDWSEEPVRPFSLTDGKCVFKVLAATVETRIVRTPGICKESPVSVSSAAVIREGIEISAADASLLTRDKIDRIREILSTA
jgi:hypothetical protein